LASAVNMLFVANRQRAGKATRSLPVKPPTPPRKKRRVDLAAVAARIRASEARAREQELST
ncbi:MAG TPA: hypothetical protein VE400_13335, partial [Mycobacterium sp.]|nr:hypothetical protein [Mycobacterium sp.]